MTAIIEQFYFLSFYVHTQFETKYNLDSVDRRIAATIGTI